MMICNVRALSSQVSGVRMTMIKAVVRNGRIEVDDPLNLPDGTQLTIPIPDQPPERADWFSLPPLDVGRFRELTSDDDLLAEMLDDA